MASCLLGVGLSVTSFGETPTASRIPTPVNARTGWAIAYLLNECFLSEYEAVVGALPEGQPRQAFGRSEAGWNLYGHAVFALAAMAAKAQISPKTRELAPLLQEQEAQLQHEPTRQVTKAQPHKRELSQAIARAGEIEPLNQNDPVVALGMRTLTDSFEAPTRRESFAALAADYALATPTCALDYKEVEAFAVRQKLLLQNNHDLNPQTLVTPLQNAELSKLQCLVIALMGASDDAKASNGFEPVHLLSALRLVNSKVAHDASLQAMYAVRLLQLGRYSDTLAVLADLAALDPELRLPYDIVQRIYSIKQRGGGAVALQGM